MAKRTDKASGKKRDRGRKRPTAGKDRRTRARPARGSGPARARSAVTSGPVDVTALTVRELADLLSVPAATIREHIKAGAPCTGGRPRRLSLIEYAAWLNRAMPRRSQATPWRSREVRTRGEAAR